MNCTGDEGSSTFNHYMVSLYWTVATVTSLGLFQYSFSTVLALKCNGCLCLHSDRIADRQTVYCLKLTPAANKLCIHLQWSSGRG